MSASEEIVQLYNANLIDIDVAVPAALHALGSSNDEIDATMERMRSKETKRCECEEEDRDLSLQQKKLSIQSAEANLKSSNSQQAAFAGDEEEENKT